MTFTANAVVIPAGSETVTLSLIASNDTIAELTETAILNIAGTTYGVASPGTAQVAIADDETPMVDVAVVQNSVYEGVTNDFARFRLIRRGDTNAATFSANVTWSGTAATSRYTTPGPIPVNPGDVNVNFDINPVNDLLLQGNQTITCTVASGGGYVVGTNTPSATAAIVDDEVLPETVLWSDDFNTDTSANWKTNFGCVNDVYDARTVIGYDYSSAASIPAIPGPPRSVSDTKGLYLTVNKDESSVLGAAGVNMYPVGPSFSGDFALRFDMYLMVGAAASTTEYTLFGINHSGNATNWFRNSTGGITNGTYDGVFVAVEADAAALGDYIPSRSACCGRVESSQLDGGSECDCLHGHFQGPTLRLRRRTEQ